MKLGRVEGRMARITFAVLAGGLLSGSCLAQDRGASEAGGAQAARVPSKFFYTVLREGGDEWMYRIPKCGAISPSVMQGLKYCEAFNGKKHHQICESSEFVESTNALTRERQKFMLIYHVLDTKKACDRDREEALKGD